MSASIRDQHRPLVVIVDDQSTGRRILEQLVRDLDSNLEVAAFADGPAALECIKARTPDLILTDYVMPEMDGIAFIRCVRGIPACDDVPLVVVTIVDNKQVRYQALDAGATDFLNRPIDEHECRARCRNLLTLRNQQKLIQDRAALLEEQVNEATRAIKARERETLLRLAKAGEYRDEGTGDHVLRIARYCRLMAYSLGLPAVRCEHIELAAPMHDIGKVGIPDQILLKPTRLTREEFAIIQRHTEIGYEILKDSPSLYLQLGATIALCHHERFDGRGYPRGLAGEAIPLEARIVAVADVFDALTTVRPYKRAWAVSEAVQYIRSLSGNHLDPACVGAFLDCLDLIESVHRALAGDGKAMPVVRGSRGQQ
ncbi:response regulator containing a CheY-like receiver domain and an HD-GYP domain [Thioflavicoccus mobilis 8321]|uniref:Response regulator containing a CheY-like receiver domain and an HD-GYP domain n=1 Tax=Thioflavicoccus mobilis 8321 TaxID=765912 RepID=L0GXD0_9GAMM|nr:HD domain-containing phosphohydrolase [Thioflavicoccus mobilis]AGA90467.1 response regulator containing a CheY-like receiver domain and an HD-GYP domain [Thioflavicoccus mobilis 8321]